MNIECLPLFCILCVCGHFESHLGPDFELQYISNRMLSERQTDRQTETETDRQTETETDRQKQRERERERDEKKKIKTQCNMKLPP